MIERYALFGMMSLTNGGFQCWTLWPLTDQDDYAKTRNYWKYLKAALKKENNELVSTTTQLKLLAADGKRYNSDMLDHDSIIALGKTFPSTKANRFIEWFTYSDKTIELS